MGRPIFTIFMLSMPKDENFGKIYPQNINANNIIMFIQNKPVALSSGEYPATFNIQGPAHNVCIA